MPKFESVEEAIDDLILAVREAVVGVVVGPGDDRWGDDGLLDGLHRIEKAVERGFADVAAAIRELKPRQPATDD